MTRKDYVLLAEAFAISKPLPIGDVRADAQRSSVFEMCVKNIGDALARENPRFDRERFLTACGVQS